MKTKITFKRNWRDYRIENLREKLTNCNLDFDISSVQEYWNRLENSLVQIADELAPITVYCNNSIAGKSKKTPHISRMLNRRKKLLKCEKNVRTQTINEEIKALNLKIKHFFVVLTDNKRVPAAQNAPQSGPSGLTKKRPLEDQQTIYNQNKGPRVERGGRRGGRGTGSFRGKAGGSNNPNPKN